MTFEEYLQDKHAAQYQGLDDEMPDNFNEWLEDMGPDEMIEYADKWAGKKIIIADLNIKYIKLKKESKEAKKIFAEAYDKHICDGVDSDIGNPCWIDTPKDDYCDSCKITQPLHKKKNKIGKEMKITKMKATVLCKKC